MQPATDPPTEECDSHLANLVRPFNCKALTKTMITETVTVTIIKTVIGTMPIVITFPAAHLFLKS